MPFSGKGGTDPQKDAVEVEFSPVGGHHRLGVIMGPRYSERRSGSWGTLGKIGLQCWEPRRGLA